MGLGLRVTGGLMHLGYGFVRRWDAEDYRLPVARIAIQQQRSDAIVGGITEQTLRR
jgi:hypothetical protein